MPIGSLTLRTSPATGQPLSPSRNGKTNRWFFSFKLTGNYPLAGDPFDLNLLLGLTVGPPGFGPFATLPEKVELQSIQSPGGTAGFIYQWAPGTTLANGKVQVFTGAAAQSGLTEFTAGAYPAGVLADTIEGEAIFPIL